MAAKGNVDSQLLAALSHAGEPGDIQYREDMRGKLDKIAIAKHTRLLIELREYNSYVNQKDLQLAFRTLAEVNEKDWHLADEKNAYAKRSATRVRVMLRDVAQNALKYNARKTQHGWHLLWDEPPAVAVETCDDKELDGEPLGPEDECGESVEVRDDADFTFGLDEEMMAAWRQPAGKQK